MLPLGKGPLYVDSAFGYVDLTRKLAMHSPKVEQTALEQPGRCAPVRMQSPCSWKIRTLATSRPTRDSRNWSPVPITSTQSEHGASSGRPCVLWRQQVGTDREVPSADI